MNTFMHVVPPGFRFRPTDEELVAYYLRNKITSKPINLDVIKDIDLYRIEPWDLQELCKIGGEEQSEWYFFSHKDKKYPTGTRTNRATGAGFWKATGRDKAIYSKQEEVIGMRKTLVFYMGRAPNGHKCDGIMHEYRLQTDQQATPQEEGWVVCKVFKKRIPSTQRLNKHDSRIWYDDHASVMQADMDSRIRNSCPSPNFKKEMSFQPDDFLHLPVLENPKLLQHQPPPGMIFDQLSHFDGFCICPGSNSQPSGVNQEEIFHQTVDQKIHSILGNSSGMVDEDQVMDWTVLDKFVASQLSQSEISRENETFPTREDSNLEIGSDTQ